MSHEWPAIQAEASLLIEFENTLGVACEECGFGWLAKIKGVETCDAFARQPEWMVRSKQDAVPWIAPRVVDQPFGYRLTL